MTDFILQRLLVQDCEQSIERNYYDWGRERGKKVYIDPDWEQADEQTRDVVCQRGYNLYDGCPVCFGDHVEAVDAWITAGFRSRIVELDVIRILARSEKARPFLAQIPDDASLEDATDEQIEAASSAIRSFLDAYQVSWAKITKILHKKRPSFMPVLDSVVFDFLWKNFPHIITQGSSLEDVLKLCRLLLQTRYHDISTIRLNLQQRGFSLTPNRVLDFILWIGWRDRVDAYGFGPKLTVVWDCPTLYEARVQAKKAWASSIT